MKVLQVAASDRAGGAAIGAYRLHKALQRAGIESEMLVLRKQTSDPTVHRLSSYLKRWQRARRRLAEYRHHRLLAANPRQRESGHWSLNLYGYSIAEVINSLQPDIVQLQWVGDNYLPIGEVAKIKAPIVWTLHDMWGFTGGCHFALGCTGYRAGCADCPQLKAPGPSTLSERVNRMKRRSWGSLPLAVVCPSHWLADCARNSAVFQRTRIEVIGNPIDGGVFKPLDRALARHAFHLPPDKPLILFGAVGGTRDSRKGFQYLKKALAAISSSSEAELVIVGGAQKEDLNLRKRSHPIGRLLDEVSLSLLYSASDVYVLPSLQDNLPNMVVEALACGTPCVTFDGSGAVDIVRHKQNGYVAKLRDSADLLRGIEWALAQKWSRGQLHEDIMARYGEQQITGQYIALYQSLLGQAK